MILLCCSLMLAILVGGGQGAAVVERQTQGTMYTVTFSPTPSLVLGVNGEVNFTTTGAGSGLNLILCQLEGDTQLGSETNSVKVLDVKQDICIYTGDSNKSGCSSKTRFQSGPQNSILVGLEGTNGNNTAVTLATIDNLFLCIGPGNGTNDVCNFYSSVFSLGTMEADGSTNSGPAASSVSFPATMTLTSTSISPSLQLLGATTITSDNGQPTLAASSASDGVPASTSLTTVTQIPSQTASETPVAASSHKSTSLSTGAKIGIALGALRESVFE
ncbi:hypothetical protein BDZ45DRAFT_276119 [Acephala macrosclerotiorum]|nr:hypothetical protein BDZ45DRAFT_276119 [Acephala macrosclerotiorum]